MAAPSSVMLTRRRANPTTEFDPIIWRDKLDRTFSCTQVNI